MVDFKSTPATSKASRTIREMGSRRTTSTPACECDDCRGFSTRLRQRGCSTSSGSQAADEYLAKQHPEEQELYALIEKARARLAAMTVTELVELSASNERKAIIAALQQELLQVVEAMERVQRAS